MSDQRLREAELAFRREPSMETATEYVMLRRRSEPAVLKKLVQSYAADHEKQSIQLRTTEWVYAPGAGHTEQARVRPRMQETESSPYSDNYVRLLTPNSIHVNGLKFTEFSQGYRNQSRVHFKTVDDCEVSMYAKNFFPCLNFMRDGWLVGVFEFQKRSGSQSIVWVGE